MDEKQKAYEKIVRCIESSKNKLHIDTCTSLIAMFVFQFDDEEQELELKFKLDEKAQKLGIIFI